ncbi:hypothetical protein D3C84_559340 [compost metagenome]
MQARFQVPEHGRDEFRLQPEQFLELGVMHFVGLQVPVPEPQLTGLQRQRQPRLTLAQGLIGGIQIKAALSHAVFKTDLGLPQLFFGLAALLDFPRQFLIKPFTATLRLLQMLDQRLILEAPHHATLDQPVDLPGHHAQGAQQNQPEPAPALLPLITAPEQIANGG